MIEIYVCGPRWAPEAEPLGDSWWNLEDGLFQIGAYRVKPGT
jgi:hypothetical protein